MDGKSGKKDVGQKFQALLSNIDGRTDEVRNLLLFLSGKPDWENAASSRRSTTTLVEHSVNVTEVMLVMNAALVAGLSLESIVICGLFHDIGKLGAVAGGRFYPRYHSTSSGLVYNREVAEISLGARSLYMLSQYVSLNQEEVQAIIASEGLYASVNEFMKYKEGRLALILHWADYWVSHVVEKPGQFMFDSQPWRT